MRTGVVIALFIIADSLAHAGFVDHTYKVVFANFDTWHGMVPAICILFMTTVQDIREIIKPKGHH
jgi:hypothetical protein